MIEELVSETNYLNLSHSKQEELIAKYCAGIKYRISSVTAKSDANKIVNDVCKGLEKECKSDVIRSFLQQYVRDIYKNHWNEK
ncbi:MAG: hypothetical protein HZB59_08815 [Ignavibacteriales bacterium]|nr:hypothetical protein [Ignavibacteriales bacterium]